jgi:fumarate reductase subunit D
MTKSNKPMIWGPFAAGGTITALLTPVLILLTLLVALGHTPQGLSYDRLHAFIANGVVKVLVFGVIALSLWSAAHRMRITLFDFGLRCDRVIAAVMYLAAAAGAVAAAVFLSAV